MTFRSFDHSVAITPHDSNTLATPTRALLVVTTGNVSVILKNSTGHTISLTSVAANTILPFACTIVKSTGTTSTVVGLY